MLKTTICFLLGMCTLLAAQAQQESSMKERMIEHLKKEKFRTPVPVEDAIASFEARYFDKKTRSSQELKVSNSSSPWSRGRTFAQRLCGPGLNPAYCFEILNFEEHLRST